MNFIETAIKTYRLSELTNRIGESVGLAFGDEVIPIIGEITNLKSAASGMFLELIEKQDDKVLAKVRAVIWKQQLARIHAFEASTGQRLKDGMKVLVRAAVAFDPLYGLSLKIKDIDPQFSIGELELQRLAIFKRLLETYPGRIQCVDDQYLTPNKSLARKSVWQRVALITSANSDGYRDFIHELDGNTSGICYQVSLFDAAVQGVLAEEQIIRQFNLIFQRKHEFDVVVLVRGGGSQTDFSAYDSFNVARACAVFPLPVLTGIGHTRNETISDQMAHQSFKTPTKVAVFLTDHNFAFLLRARKEAEHIQSFALRNHSERKADGWRTKETFGYVLATVLERNRKVLQTLAQELYQAAHRRHQEREEVRRHIATHIGTLAHSGLLARQNVLRLLFESVRLLNPALLLAQGYAVLHRNGERLTDATRVQAGDRLNVRVSNGDLDVTVNHVTLKP